MEEEPMAACDELKRKRRRKHVGHARRRKHTHLPPTHTRTRLLLALGRLGQCLANLHHDSKGAYELK